METEKWQENINKNKYDKDTVFCLWTILCYLKS
jgi:hypothetical protein